MNRKLFIDIYDRLEGLVTRLPGSVQAPILRELRPVKHFFLLQRPPRVAVASATPALWARTMNALFGMEILSEREAASAETLQDWFPARAAGRGQVLLSVAGTAASQSAVTSADVLLAIIASGSSSNDCEKEASRLVDILSATLPGNPRETPYPVVLGVVTAREGESPDAAESALHNALRNNATIAPRLAATMVLQTTPPSQASSMAAFDGSRRSLAKALCEELPNEARLDAARLFNVPEEQEEIARTLIKSISAVAGVIGAQPIPFADFPILTTLQIGMICGIIYISGNEPSLALAGRFLTATGMNLGAGLILREGARGLSKLLPGWGQAIGGGVAATGTYAIGRAASAHFINGVGIDQARGILREFQGRLLPHR